MITPNWLKKILSGLIVAAGMFAMNLSVYAAPYGAGSYGECQYSQNCSQTANPASSGSTPSTGGSTDTGIRNLGSPGATTQSDPKGVDSTGKPVESLDLNNEALADQGLSFKTIWWSYLCLLLAALLFFWWFLIAKRRRKKDEEDSKELH